MMSKWAFSKQGANHPLQRIESLSKSQPKMEFLFASLVVLLFVSFYFSQKRWRRETVKRKLPPSPPAALPVIGHLHLLRNAKVPHVTLGAMADKYGPIFSLRLGTRPALVVSNWAMARESLCVNDAAAASRLPLSAVGYFAYDFAFFGLAPYGDYCREIRKITHLELLSSQRVEQLKHIMFSEIDLSLSELHKTWAAQRNESDQILVDLKSWFSDLNLNILLKIIIGKRCVGPKAEGDEKEVKQLHQAVKDSFRIMGDALLGDYIPLLGLLTLRRQEKLTKKIAKKMDDTLTRWLEEHKRKKASDFADNGRDFMDALISILDGKTIGGFDGDTIIKATTLNMISAGIESSTVTVTWAICLLLNHPHALAMAQQELDAAVGSDRRVSESDIDKLVFLQAIVKETMRLKPAAPLLGPRGFCEDCIVGGYFVSKGTQLIPNIWKIQTDPEVWPDPLEFKPERFLTTHKNVDVRGNHFELIPFGSGRRGCPGISFGLQMIHFALGGFLHSFEIRTPAGEAVDMSEYFGIANAKATPLDVLISPRLPSHLQG